MKYSFLHYLICLSHQTQHTQNWDNFPSQSCAAFRVLHSRQIHSYAVFHSALPLHASRPQWVSSEPPYPSPGTDLFIFYITKSAPVSKSLGGTSVYRADWHETAGKKEEELSTHWGDPLKALKFYWTAMHLSCCLCLCPCPGGSVE